MNHIGTQKLESTRLILRQFTDSDAGAMYQNWASDPKVTHHLTWPPHAGIEVTQSLLSDWIKQYDQPHVYNWLIEEKNLRTPIGSISVVRQDERLQSAEIGYCIGTPWWHQGYATEACKTVVDFLFDQVGFCQICARHVTDNPHSGAVMQKVGMRPEGILLNAVQTNHGLCDVVLYHLRRTNR